ncbi:class I adenylate-forming enzyme family protein [Micromonospora sp. HM5-17]|jgi:acyl-CoA synthetase (AMP-forming)/AMP-acid ligase II|uniref:class I adenylate-forming enzyme family protein n=1 Tax=Micromonospora sp. HM5-17 TaxID=2487710 RepID=UPI000F4823F5|nr:AMP-binding protein [Micromonospora sp. HM5-17]ROT33831.1 long-chain fatty acid--CoA ligase [Micromonospora sp. HM5-17]
MSGAEPDPRPVLPLAGPAPGSAGPGRHPARPHRIPARPAGPGYPQAILDLLAAGRDRPVFEHGPRIVGADEMRDLIGRIATGLRDAGIGPGDGVALVLGVTPEAFAATIAAQVVGARVAGVRPGLTPGQLRHILGHRIAAVLVDPSTATPPLRSAAAGLRLLAVGPVDGTPDLTATPAPPSPPVPAGRPDDIARVVYTSGSTGDPKGCLQTYAALGRAWAPYPDRWPPAVRDLAGNLDRYLVFGSLSSQVMLEYGILTLAAGGTMVVADPPRGPEPFFPAAIARHRATASVITVPRLAKLVAVQRNTPADLGSLRALLVSGSPLDPGRLAEAMAVLGPVIYHGYGQTETGMISMVTPAELSAALAGRRPTVHGPSTHPPASPAPLGGRPDGPGVTGGPSHDPGGRVGSSDILASVGRPPDAVEVQVRDADGRPVPVGTAGELFVRTPAQASGYWADPAETAEVFVDGWVRTRDLARLDADGYLYLLGRTRDVIIVNADLRYAGPIERTLASHPDVAEAYVVAAPDEETGEAVHAFVVPAEGRRPDPAVLRTLVRERLGAASVPRVVTVIGEVPVSPAGKPDKRRLLAGG